MGELTTIDRDELQELRDENQRMFVALHEDCCKDFVNCNKGCEHLVKQLRADIASRQSWQESTAVYLADADRALTVLFTMLTKVGLKEGAAVADETRAHVRAALKEVAHSKSTAQPLPGGMQRDKMPGECAPIWPPEPEKLGGEQS